MQVIMWLPSILETTVKVAKQKIKLFHVALMNGWTSLLSWNTSKNSQSTRDFRSHTSGIAWALTQQSKPWACIQNYSLQATASSPCNQSTSFHSLAVLSDQRKRTNWSKPIWMHISKITLDSVWARWVLKPLSKISKYLSCTLSVDKTQWLLQKMLRKCMKIRKSILRKRVCIGSMGLRLLATRVSTKLGLTAFNIGLTTQKKCLNS